MHFTVIQLSQTSQWVLQLFCYSSLKASKYINLVYPEWIRTPVQNKEWWPFSRSFHVHLLQHQEFQLKMGTQTTCKVCLWYSRKKEAEMLFMAHLWDWHSRGSVKTKLKQASIRHNRRHLRSARGSQGPRALCGCLRPELQERKGSSSLEKLQSVKYCICSPERDADNSSFTSTQHFLAEQAGRLPRASSWPHFTLKCWAEVTPTHGCEQAGMSTWHRPGRCGNGAEHQEGLWAPGGCGHTHRAHIGLGGAGNERKDNTSAGNFKRICRGLS